MILKEMSKKFSTVCFMAIFFMIPFQNAMPGDRIPTNCCLERAIEKIIEIRSYPVKKYLYTLDGQKIQLNEFHAKCLELFPKCCLFEKFYYWQSEIKEIVSTTDRGLIKHKIRCYRNCLSECCPDIADAEKTHGDVAEFYDENGDFMGLSVYMGSGKYCPIPYDGYRK